MRAASVCALSLVSTQTDRNDLKRFLYSLDIQKVCPALSPLLHRRLRRVLTFRLRPAERFHFEIKIRTRSTFPIHPLRRFPSRPRYRWPASDVIHVSGCSQRCSCTEYVTGYRIHFMNAEIPRWIDRSMNKTKKKKRKNHLMRPRHVQQPSI